MPIHKIKRTDATKNIAPWNINHLLVFVGENNVQVHEEGPEWRYK